MSTPRRPDAAGAVEGLAASTGGFLVGGLTAAAGETPHQAGGATGTLSGVALSPAAVEIATALSQGCTPLGRAHEVTRGQDNILVELDGRRALDVFVEDIGEELAADLRRVGGLIFAALPVAGSDTADYTVRNLVGIDPTSGVIAIGEAVPEGGKVLFCRRDRETAARDMRRMAEDLKRRVGERVSRGGVYVSCAARGPNQFASPERETEIIRDTLGTFPMVGFFANGELNRDRIYGLHRRPHPLSLTARRRSQEDSGPRLRIVRKQVADSVDLVRRKVVHDHDVARPEGRRQHLLDTGPEHFPVHRAVQHQGRDHLRLAQPGHEGGRLPVAVRHRADQPFGPRRPAPGPRHRGRGPGLVKEDQPLRRELMLLLPPALTLRRHVRTRLFGCVRGCF